MEVQVGQGVQGVQVDQRVVQQVVQQVVQLVDYLEELQVGQQVEQQVVQPMAQVLDLQAVCTAEVVSQFLILHHYQIHIRALLLLQSAAHLHQRLIVRLQDINVEVPFQELLRYAVLVHLAQVQAPLRQVAQVLALLVLVPVLEQSLALAPVQSLALALVQSLALALELDFVQWIISVLRQIQILAKDLW